MQHKPHQYKDEPGHGSCTVCGLKLKDPDAHHTEYSCCIRDGCGMVYNMPVQPIPNPDGKLRAFANRYCPKHRELDTPALVFTNQEPTDQQGTTADVWLRHMFEYEFCHECGKDMDKHTAVMVLGNWFARCNEPREDA